MWAMGATAALLVALDPIWRAFSRLAMTDVLASTLTIAAMFVLVADPMLELRSWPILRYLIASPSRVTVPGKGVSKWR